eukprot:TRINITY_DN2428_c0_g1_i1.p1 TRINITY_DN2428_c0_g1~~TRINITY_DN2428_c0_g1_i1.p1  ORF type:complete len:127 (-),score=24.81 TRINITY_DN2428_c0_g1_i1:102-482(-)
MTDQIQNLQTRDPFADDLDDLGAGPSGAAEASASTKATGVVNYVHIRVQQRNARKTLTTVQGLDPKLDFKKVLKAFKKGFSCNGTIIDDEDKGKILQLQGDQRQVVAQFLTGEGIVNKDHIKIHGY